ESTSLLNFSRSAFGLRGVFASLLFTPRTIRTLTKRRFCRCLFSFRRREGYVGYSSFSANVQYADDIFVRARFVATDHYRLLGVQLNQALKQFSQLGAG